MSTEEKKKSYKDTLNLPQTAFPMEAKLVQNEPPRLKKWQDMQLYDKVLQQHAADPLWVLHDGPPFANGDIHIGHVINKTLKDVIIRFRTMQGHRVPYVPGWDCHGLPIEHKIQQELGSKMREMSVVDVRRKCYDYAAKYAALQNEQFQRLGILGDWAHPYWTMERSYEANTLEVFARFVEKGLVYKKLKPVPWSIANQTALADAELEYKDVEDTSVFVRFPMVDSSATGKLFGLTGDRLAHLLIWTTTPWTLPANLAVAVHPDIDYVAVSYESDGQSHVGIIAAALRETVLTDVTVTSVSRPVKGAQLVESKLVYKHPFLDQTGVILPALYVTTEDGTGLVHTAPGHGEDDYLTGITHKLPIYCPVLHNGTFDKTAPEWLQGIVVWKANPLIIDRLKSDGLLLKVARISHSYPHDWRSKTPIIFRATEQWFIAVDKPFAVSESKIAGQTLRDLALSAIETSVEFIPTWGQARLQGMLRSRPDWCISRQRVWGLPIPVFYNQQGEPLLTPQTVRAVAKRFAENGSEAFFTMSPTELLEGVDTGPNFPKDSLRKETDIFDVWFESGSSWHDVLQKRAGLKFPCDLYLEGSDQHRGWFQLSLLPSLGYNGVPPYQQVLTHGFIVKPDGTKVSKSDKEYVTAVQEINRHGADVLRLWCSSVDYQGDIQASPKMIQDFGDKYRKIRNTLRYMLSNLSDFDPAKEAQEIPLRSLDAWILAQLDQLIIDVTQAYDTYALHRAFRLLHDFCAVQLSAVYGNAMKDRLYCESPDAPIRRRCQTAMHQIVIALTKMLAPMVVYTADEAWEYIQHKPASEANLASVHLSSWPKCSGQTVHQEQQDEWKMLMELRDAALQQLDTLKKEKGLNKASEAEIVYQIDDDEMRRRLQEYGGDLEDLVGAGHHTFAEVAVAHPAVRVKILDRREQYQACARSWKRRPDVGEDPAYPDLSLRDAAALKALKACA